jgi:hypothetical protein
MTINLHQACHTYFLRPEKEYSGIKTSEESFLGSITGEGCSCRSETKDGPYEQSCLFRRKDYRNIGYNLEKTVLSSNPSEVVYCILENVGKRR